MGANSLVSQQSGCSRKTYMQRYTPAHTQHPITENVHTSGWTLQVLVRCVHVCMCEQPIKMQRAI